MRAAGTTCEAIIYPEHLTEELDHELELAVIIGKAPDFFEGVVMPELFLADALGCVY